MGRAAAERGGQAPLVWWACGLLALTGSALLVVHIGDAIGLFGLPVVFGLGFSIYAGAALLLAGARKWKVAIAALWGFAFTVTCLWVMFVVLGSEGSRPGSETRSALILFSGALTAGLLGLLTRSTRVACVTGCALLACVAVVFTHEIAEMLRGAGLGTEASRIWAQLTPILGWHAVVSWVMLSWGMRMRRAIREKLCKSCGYSLVGLRAGKCPECGVEIGVGTARGAV